jgi:hypothetical protein
MIGSTSLYSAKRDNFLRKKINPLKRIKVQINLLAEKLFIITIIEKKGKDVKG